jgi:hypothetical protein
MRLRGFDIKMYPRWPAKSLSGEAYDELRHLFTELKIISSPAKAQQA